MAKKPGPGRRRGAAGAAGAGPAGGPAAGAAGGPAAAGPAAGGPAAGAGPAAAGPAAGGPAAGAGPAGAPAGAPAPGAPAPGPVYHVRHYVRSNPGIAAFAAGALLAGLAFWLWPREQKPYVSGRESVGVVDRSSYGKDFATTDMTHKGNVTFTQEFDFGGGHVVKFRFYDGAEDNYRRALGSALTSDGKDVRRHKDAMYLLLRAVDGDDGEDGHISRASTEKMLHWQPQDLKKKLRALVGPSAAEQQTIDDAVNYGTGNVQSYASPAAPRLTREHAITRVQPGTSLESMTSSRTYVAGTSPTHTTDRFYCSDANLSLLKTMVPDLFDAKLTRTAPRELARAQWDVLSTMSTFVKKDTYEISDMIVQEYAASVSKQEDLRCLVKDKIQQYKR